MSLLHLLNNSNIVCFSVYLSVLPSVWPSFEFLRLPDMFFRMVHHLLKIFVPFNLIQCKNIIQYCQFSLNVIQTPLSIVKSL
jgi:hypothetical protein